MEKICKIHGLSEFSDGKRPRCRKCLVNSVQKRRTKMKTMAIEYKGGKCKNCGYNKCIGALTFHHVNPKEKSFGISAKGYTRAWNLIKAELDKCELLCANCHIEKHYNQI